MLRLFLAGSFSEKTGHHSKTRQALAEVCETILRFMTLTVAPLNKER